jgi:hypothetical protein
MPNPSILGPRGTDLKPPESRQLLWNVYRLRRNGLKLDRRDILGTHRVGHLVIEPRGAAVLHDERGWELEGLREVRVRRLTAGGGLLLVGREAGRDGTAQIAQAWWCVLKAVG